MVNGNCPTSTVPRSSWLPDHPLFHGPIDPAAFAAADHIGISRRGRVHGPIDTALARQGLRTFEIRLEVPPLDIGMAWHPRHEADPAHRWFRNRIRTAVSIPSSGGSAQRPES